MKLTTTAFKRKARPATAALEESLRLDEHQAPLERKRRRHAEPHSLNRDNASPYGMSALRRETERLEHSFAFPVIEWCFDDDSAVASERGSLADDDACIESRPVLQSFPPEQKTLHDLDDTVFKEIDARVELQRGAFSLAAILPAYYAGPALLACIHQDSQGTRVLNTSHNP
jgi:hypothetical protein